MQISFWFWSEQCFSIFNPSNLVPDEFEKNFIPTKFWKNLELQIKFPPKFLPLKLLSAILLIFFFFFTKWEPLKIFEKCFSFQISDFVLEIFTFLYFYPSHHPVGHCFRRWSKMNFKVHDVMNCLKKNSIKHSVWYLEKEKRFDIETLSIDGVSDKEHFL